MIKVGILIFPQVEELDFVGPYEVLSYINKIKPGSTKVFLVAESLDAVLCFNGMRVLPDITTKDCPPLDILVVPGGKGRLKTMYDAKIKEFVTKQAKHCKYVTSVCTGAFILAEAGLLEGKKATTYHSALNELASYATITVRDQVKVVHDGKIMTAGGVSSGLELGLYLLKVLFDKKTAQEVAAGIEYYIGASEEVY